MVQHSEITDRALRKLIRREQIHFGGNNRLKIYGKLNCHSGKKLHRENRAFFDSEKEAQQYGYRPCGHCMNKEYKKWKNGLVFK